MKIKLLTLLLLASFLKLEAQVGIGTQTPNSSAALEVSDTSKGLLIPRMTMNQRKAINNPAQGLMVYQTDSTQGFWYSDGVQWININSQGLSGISGGIHLQVYTSGTYNWTVPSGVSSVVVEMWSGGGGGSVGNYNFCGGSGGAGAYGKGSVNVVAGDIIPITVGSGGAGCNVLGGNQGCNGTDGGSTSFGGLIIATGGGGGTYGVNQHNGLPGSCNALLNCSSITPTPCVNNMGIKYGLGGNSACNSGGGTYTSEAGKEGYLILMW